MSAIFPNLFRKLAALLTFSLACIPASGAISVSREQMATLQHWLPESRTNLDLLFEYYPDSPEAEELDVAELHKIVDRAGPTLVVLQARRPYEKQARLIGGYNPHKWRTWFGRYEKSPGLFIFDLRSGKKWDRRHSRSGTRKVDASSYGLQFGCSDLILNADLSTGSASNHCFADGPGSVLMGDSGPFIVEAIAIFRVASDPIEDPGAGHLSFRSSEPSSRLRPVYPVPDASLALPIELLALLSLLAARIALRARR